MRLGPPVRPVTFLVLAVAAAAGVRPAPAAAPVVIDDFEDPTAWSAHPADGVGMTLRGEAGESGLALRLDYRFGGGGWAIARREVVVPLPADYTLRFRLRGVGPVNTLELKLSDASGENVWWRVWRAVDWPAEWRGFAARKRQITFAWGPQGGGELRRVAAIEFAVTAVDGGAGTIWIDELELVPRETAAGPPPPPTATASSAVGGHAPALAVDGDRETRWAAAPGDPAPELIVDLGRLRDYGGLTVDWAPGSHAADYELAADSGDGAWRALATVTGGNGGRDYLFLPESEARRVRLRAVPGARAPAIAEMVVQPWEWSASREAFFGAVASDARRGLYPRSLRAEQIYWTVVGLDADRHEGLLSEDAALESGPRRFTLEPFLWTDGRLYTWADTEATPALNEGDLPLPAVTRRGDDWELTVTVTAAGEPGEAALLARYTVANQSARARSATLFLALRPFQVNPPSQFLNIQGGVAPVRSIVRARDHVLVDGEIGVITLTQPDRFGATTFAGGDVVAEHLEYGALPSATAVTDPFAAASAALAFDLDLEAGETREVALLVPMNPEAGWPAGIAAAAAIDSVFTAAAAAWRERYDRVVITGPPAAADALATMRAQLGYILVNRAGAAIQPGSRAYARSWIRDGALTGVALLRLGHPEVVHEFLEWFAPFQYESGKIPCVVDRRGADPVPEHDATGEFIHLVTEYYRYTGDRDFARLFWPRVIAGVAYLEALLGERRTDDYAAAERREFYGILPPSISHEGYSAKPMHSYWDDFWALRGYRDAVFLAGELAISDETGRGPTAADLSAQRDRFTADLAASVQLAMQKHAIDYVPGCADLGDFDATSTTIALDPTAVGAVLPAGALQTTFAKYWDFFCARRDGAPWEALTPYEMRNIGAFIRLGWREQAAELLAYFLAMRRPPQWRHWAEVVGRDARTARFIGDMPHTWVGSDYVRSLLDMFVYERRGESGEPAALVLAAGLPAAWLADGGVRVADLPTPYGRLAYTLRRDAAAVVMDIAAGLQVPPGGLVLRPPDAGDRVAVDERPVTAVPAGGVVVRQLPARVVWRD